MLYKYDVKILKIETSFIKTSKPQRLFIPLPYLPSGFPMQGARPCDSDGALVKPGVARAVDDVTGEIFDSNKINQYSEEM